MLSMGEDGKECIVMAFLDLECAARCMHSDEKYYIENLRKLKTIKHLFFELHYNIFNDSEVSKIMKKLKKNRFKLKDKCFNSFYFVKY